MTTEPIATASHSSVLEAAQLMRAANVGSVIVTEDEGLCGILTDRDIVLRGVAEGHDLERLKVAEICSPELTTVAPDDSVDDAVQLMRDRALRRLPVVEDGKAVGIVSLGDVAILKAGWRQRVRSSGYVPKDDDPALTLADISAAPPNA
ncbi:MAG TPA: CBS domain-containing protein [Acidimicrobiales bacterium]|nr:CBS domain-containing protein [Acidimicrobiales bacterium]